MSTVTSASRKLITGTACHVNWLIIFSIVFCLLLQLHLQFVQKINWDEFFFLSMIYEHQRGELAKPLQTLHVHIFSWLTFIGKDEIQKIEIARFCMWIFEVGTLVLIYLTSRLFCSKRASLIGVLCFICSGYVLVHGTSFRADPMAAFFSMLCVFLLAGSKLSYKSLFLMGIAAAIAIHITVKVVLFLPLFLWLAVWQIPQFDSPIEPIKRLVVAAVLCLLFGVLIYTYQLQVMPENASRYSASVVTSAPSTVLVESGFLPRWQYIKESAVLSMPQLLLLLIGTAICIVQIARSGMKKVNSIVLLGMLLPLVSLLFYRNAFPYYFPFIFPPSMCVVAYGVTIFQNQNYLIVGLVLVLVGNHLVSYFGRIEEDQESQKSVISFMHKAFPEGVNYIDRCSMFSSSKKFGYFMSRWGHESYRNNGRPVIQDQALKSVVPVVIANSWRLQYALENRAVNPADSLVQSDAEYLRNNYIHHWGGVWVAGVEVLVASQGASISISIPGVYTVESSHPVTIDGSVLVSGDTVRLSKGVINIASDYSHTVVLRWGDNLYRPLIPPKKKRMFSAF